ncbi:hypothetical protein AJ80_09826 [Polytolypa hystricis UAMH7299]|uniref:MARVEL domain-containing protein n=1 Tax=Polytolypa hystricis (strain UAMH7299) TaxID=1447883 RepID=A0A2B7WIK5_POLH7|nr:hypothetical protein AJ80_09826 [Polytolypa hystricis UAMH7299]
MPSSQSSGDLADHSPVSPIDVVNTSRSKRLSFPKPKKSVDFYEKSSSHSKAPSLKSPRTPRFAEATSVYSPIDPAGRSPFADPLPMSGQQESSALKPADSVPNVSDVGFGYVADNEPARHAIYPDQPQTANGPPKSPLKSALKTPGTPGRALNPLSPTFREEQILEHHESSTEKEQVKDVKVKTRVRMAKMLLRGVNFSCSLIILALVASSLTIFNTTRNLASKNSFTPWATNTNPWAQILVLVIACISLLFCVGVFIGYCRGGHGRAEKVAVYYTVFAACFFVFSIVMWVVAAAVLQNSKNSGDDKDLWGWACKDSTRRKLYEDEVNYSLVCRMQDWSLICCIIEIIIEIITIAIYAVVFYRFYSKRKLRKSMDVRDKARSDLYLAQLRSQSAPNTPGFPRSPGAPFTPISPMDPHSAAEKGQGYYTTQYAVPQSPTSAVPTQQQPFQLQAPPIRIQAATPSISQSGFSPQSPTNFERVNEHITAAPGEQTYDAVPIPGAYASPLTSPTFAPQSLQLQTQNQQGQGNIIAPGTAVTTNSPVGPRDAS